MRGRSCGRILRPINRLLLIAAALVAAALIASPTQASHKDKALTRASPVS